MHRESRTILLIYLLLAFVGAGVTLIALLRIPTDTGSGWLLGLSPARLVLACSVFLLMVLSGVLLVQIWRGPSWGNRFGESLANLLNRDIIYIPLVMLSLVGVVIGAQLYHLSRLMVEPSLKAYLIRILPLAAWVSVLCAQTLIALPLLRYGIKTGSDQGTLDEKPNTRIPRGIVQVSAIAFGIFLLIWGIIALTGLGITPDAVGWDDPGVPILPIQVWLVWLIGITFFIAGVAYRKMPERFRNLLHFPTVDILIGLVIWLVAIWLWSAQPMQPNYFAPRPSPPNFEYYPYSDAAGYAFGAQRLLIGRGYPGVGIKPLYILFLTVLHAVKGQGYEDIVGLQVICLALFPVILYFLGSGLHHRLSGALAAILIILRESNALSLSGTIRVSNAKLMMTDLPTALGIALLVWVVAIWWQKRGQDPHQRERLGRTGLIPLIAGGVLGFVVLLRPQAFILVPALFTAMILIFWCRPILGLREGGLCLLGLTLAISPWLWRGWEMTGRIVINDPGQTTFLTEQYNIVPGSPRLQALPGESASEFDKRVQQTILKFIREHPGIVAHFISAHFLHNQVETLLALPSSSWFSYRYDSWIITNWRRQPAKLWEECCSLDAFVAVMPFWKQWQGDLPGESWLPLLINLALISLGIGVSWHRKGVGGLVPLGASLVYNFGNALGRYSGWRFILPVDWTAILYYAIGLGQVTLWLVALYMREKVFALDEDRNFGKACSRLGSSETHTWHWRGVIQYAAVSAVILLLGFCPLWAEWIIPPRYPLGAKEELIARLDLERVLNPAETAAGFSIKQILNSKEVVVLQGRALYPRYYRAEQGGSMDGWAAYVSRENNRLGFTLMGPIESRVVLVLNDVPGSGSIPAFPNASDVVVIGCPEGNYVEALAVVLQNAAHDVLVSSALPNITSTNKPSTTEPACPPVQP